MARRRTINDIINQVASETGLSKTADVFASPDDAFVQLISLANACGQELLQDFAWQSLNKEHQVVTQEGDSGVYDLPEDFAYMIPQTGWERAENVPLFGPLSEQTWQYLLGRDLVSYTIYASFRLQDNKFNVFPIPPPVGLDIHFEYCTLNWVVKGPNQFADMLTEPSDIPNFVPFMFERLLKLRWLEAKGFDTTVAQQQYEKSAVSWAGKDKSAPILNAGGSTRSYPPLLDPYCNTPDTNFGGG